VPQRLNALDPVGVLLANNLFSRTCHPELYEQFTRISETFDKLLEQAMMPSLVDAFFSVIVLC